jgi:hypothetical protein
MPSARELLEQADALMRRNRSPLMDDIPVLTDAVPEVRPGRPARLRPAPPESSAPDTVPMLTERLAPEPPPSPPVAPPSKAVVEEGEPSDWLQIDGEEPSVIGDAPDSIAMVPPPLEEAGEEIEVEAPPEVEASFDAELAERKARSPLPTALLTEPAPVFAEPIATVAEPAPVFAEPIAPVAEPAPLPAESITVTESIMLPTEPDPPEFVAGAEPSRAPGLIPDWEGSAIAGEPDEEELASGEMELPAELTVPSVGEGVPIEDAVEAGPTPAELQAAEDARWASMAEEIRMQVLQRIDLFTDTGLRDQLGARLQPIVDRASADLVATINQHVGELLRAYVAEAIEREIENWRRGA